VRAYPNTFSGLALLCRIINIIWSFCFSCFSFCNTSWKGARVLVANYTDQVIDSKKWETSNSKLPGPINQHTQSMCWNVQWRLPTSTSCAKMWTQSYFREQKMEDFTILHSKRVVKKCLWGAGGEGRKSWLFPNSEHLHQSTSQYVLNEVRHKIIMQKVWLIKGNFKN